MLGKPNFASVPEYYKYYINIVPESNLIEAYNQGLSLIQNISLIVNEKNAAFAYAPNKWSVRDLIRHCIDTERILFYRILRFSRNDSTPLMSFDENAYAEEARIDCSIASLIEEWTFCRQSNIAFIKNTKTESFDIIGVANDVQVTGLAIAWMVEGHARHHLNVLKEKYLPLLQ